MVEKGALIEVRTAISEKVRVGERFIILNEIFKYSPSAEVRAEYVGLFSFVENYTLPDNIVLNLQNPLYQSLNYGLAFDNMALINTFVLYGEFVGTTATEGRAFICVRENSFWEIIYWLTQTIWVYEYEEYRYYSLRVWHILLLLLIIFFLFFMRKGGL